MVHVVVNFHSSLCVFGLCNWRWYIYVTGEGLLCLVASLLSLICVGRLFGSYGLQTDIKELLVNELGMVIVCKGGPCCAIKWGAAR